MSDSPRILVITGHGKGKTTSAMGMALRASGHGMEVSVIQQGHNTEKLQPIELYNLKDDIGETNNLADKRPKLVAKVEKIFKEAYVPSEHFIWKRNIKSHE